MGSYPCLGSGGCQCGNCRGKDLERHDDTIEEARNVKG